MWDRHNGETGLSVTWALGLLLKTVILINGQNTQGWIRTAGLTSVNLISLLGSCAPFSGQKKNKKKQTTYQHPDIKILTVEISQRHGPERAQNDFDRLRVKPLTSLFGQGVQHSSYFRTESLIKWGKPLGRSRLCQQIKGRFFSQCTVRTRHIESLPGRAITV